MAPWKVGSAFQDDLVFEETLAWFRARLPLTKQEWEQLDATVRRKAFTIADAAQLDAIQDVHDQVERAIAKGFTLDEFRARVEPAVTSAWRGSVEQPAWRLEVIFRNGVQGAYGAGRYRQLTDPDVLAARPVWMLDAVLDGRTSNVCRKLDGVTRPASDPFWSSHIPPLHHLCRTVLRSLTQADGEARGLTARPPTVEPSDGWGQRPDVSEWSPDRARYSADLWAEHARKVGQVS